MDFLSRGFEDEGGSREDAFENRSIMVGAPKVFEIRRRDELEAWGRDGRVAEDVEVFRREVATDVERMAGAAAGVLLADVFGGIQEIAPVGSGAERRCAETLEIPATDCAALKAGEGGAGGGAAVVIILVDVRHFDEGKLQEPGVAFDPVQPNKFIENESGVYFVIAGAV